MPEQLRDNEEYQRMEEGFDASQKRLSSAFEAIFAKYGNPENEDDGDIIDLNTGEIVEDRGHLKSLETQKGPGLWQKVMGGDYDDDDDDDGWVTYRDEEGEDAEEPPQQRGQEQRRENDNDGGTARVKADKRQRTGTRRLTTPVTRSNWLLDDDAFDNLLTPTAHKRGTKRRPSNHAFRSPSVKKMMEEESDDDTMLITPIRRKNSSFLHTPVRRNNTSNSQCPTLLTQEDEPREEGPAMDLASSPEPPSSINQVVDKDPPPDNDDDDDVQVLDKPNSINDNDSDDHLMTNNDDKPPPITIEISDDEDKQQPAPSNDDQSSNTAPTPPRPPTYPQGPTALQRLFATNPFAYADFKQQERLRIINQS
jgi:hypothetical protein